MQPLGFIEIDTTGARWVPLEPSRAELGLRAMMLVAVMLPFGGRRGWLLGVLALAAQMLIGQLTRVRMPAGDIPVPGATAELSA